MQRKIRAYVDKNIRRIFNELIYLNYLQKQLKIYIIFQVRSAIRPEGVNNSCGGNRNSETGSGQPTEVVTGTSSTAETEETEVCSTTQQRPSLPISTSSPTFSNVKETIQRTATGSPPPPYEVGLQGHFHFYYYHHFSFFTNIFAYTKVCLGAI